MNRTRITRTLQFTARFAGWMLIALVSLELCARTEDLLRYGAPFFGNYSIDTLYRNTPAGKFGKPGARYMKWQLNGEGFRGPELRPGSFRIVCIGSSETFGLYESPGMEWPRQMERDLNAGRPGAPFEVVDAAYPGMSIATSLRRLPQTLAALHPQMAVIYPSYTPYIELDHPVPENEAAPVPPPAKPAGREAFEWRIAGRFQTLAKATVPESIQHWLRARQMQHDTEAGTVRDRLPQQNIDAFAADLDQLTRQLEAHGVRVVLITHANRFGVRPITPADRPFLTDWRKFFPSLRENGFLDMEQRMSDAVRAVGARRGIPVVDAATLVPPGRDNFVEFVHFTDAGAGVLARSVAAAVQRDAPGAAQ